MTAKEILEQTKVGSEYSAYTLKCRVDQLNKFAREGYFISGDTLGSIYSPRTQLYKRVK